MFMRFALRAACYCCYFSRFIVAFANTKIKMSLTCIACGANQFTNITKKNFPQIDCYLWLSLRQSFLYWNNDRYSQRTAQIFHHDFSFSLDEKTNFFSIFMDLQNIFRNFGFLFNQKYFEKPKIFSKKNKINCVYFLQTTFFLVIDDDEKWSKSMQTMAHLTSDQFCT